MKKRLFYILIFIILCSVMLPELIYALKTENGNKNIICSVKIHSLNNEVINTLTDHSVKNIKHLILVDSIFTDPDNSNYVMSLVQSGYKLGISMDLASKTSEYYSNLKTSADKFDVDMFYFEEKNNDFDKETLDKISALAREKGINIGLLENSQQNGLHYGDKLYSEVLNGISERALFLYKSDIWGNSEEDLKYRLLRSVVDRGIRYISLEVSDKNSLISYDSVYGGLYHELDKKGYGYEAGTIVKVTDNNKLKAITVTLFSIIQLIVFLCILDVNKKHIKFYIALFTLAIITMFFMSYNLAMLINVFSITVTVPASAALWMYRQFDKTNSFLRIMKYHLLFFIAYIFSGCFIWLALSGYAFRIGIEAYKLAIPSYILPLITIILFVFRTKEITSEEIKKAFSNRITIAVTLLTILLVYIYLSRSGNNSLLPATYPELKFRIMLEDLNTARPRLKEFLIGYPCFFLYLTLNKEKLKILHIYLLLGSTIVGISILNTFCHSFTPVNISIIRAFSGFILGTITAAASACLLGIFTKSALKVRSGYSLPDSRNR